MHFTARRATYAALTRESIRQHGHYGLQCPSLRFALSRPCPSRCLRSFSLPLGGCSFDLGSWATRTRRRHRPSSRSRPARSADKAPATRRATPRAARRWPGPARPKRRWPNSTSALALDPYNVQALYGRGLIYQGEKQHQQAIEDFTSANGLTPQRAEPLLARAISYLAHRQGQGSRRRSRRGGAGRPQQRASLVGTRDRPMNASATRPRRSLLQPRARDPPPGRSRAKRPRAHRRLGF